MKKIVVTILMTVASMAFLAGCNKQVVDWNYSFKKAYVKVGDEWINIEVKTWADYEDGEQLQLTLKDGTVMVVHSANCILYNGTLPNAN